MAPCVGGTLFSATRTNPVRQITYDDTLM